MNLPCTFPGGHEIRLKIQCSNRKMVCLVKQETSEGARWPQWKRGQNPVQYRNIYSHKATIASLWSEGLLGPTDQKSMFYSLKNIIVDMQRKSNRC